LRCCAAATAAALPPSCRQRCVVVLQPTPQHPRCCNRAAAGALCTATALCAAAATSTDAATAAQKNQNCLCLMSYSPRAWRHRWWLSMKTLRLVDRNVQR
jgi:hypothetical protein